MHSFYQSRIESPMRPRPMVCWWPWVTPMGPNHPKIIPISTFCITFRIS